MNTTPLTPEQIAARYQVALDILTSMIMEVEKQNDSGTDPEGIENGSDTVSVQD